MVKSFAWRHCHPPQVQAELFPDGFQATDHPLLTVLSFGAGQDSAAILYLLGHDHRFRTLFAPQDLIVIFADTGAEHKETYDQALPDAKAFCAKHRIPFFHLEPGSAYHSEAWPDLLAFYRRTATCGSRGFPRSCTDQLKIRVLYRFLEHYLGETYGVKIGRKSGFYRYAARFGPCRVLIGLSAEEGGRCSIKQRPLWMRRCIEIRYPLQELGATRATAQAIIQGLGYQEPCPSSCRVCPFLTLRDLLWKYRTRRDEYDELLDLEQIKRAKWHHLGAKNYGIFGAIPLPEALDRAHLAFGHLSDQQLTDARMQDGHAVRSTY